MGAGWHDTVPPPAVQLGTTNDHHRTNADPTLALATEQGANSVPSQAALAMLLLRRFVHDVPADDLIHDQHRLTVASEGGNPGTAAAARSEPASPDGVLTPLPYNHNRCLFQYDGTVFIHANAKVAT
eukprot:GHVU01223795.1.p1 GENE.GHVU01223795.1~~GHVU01223795.1.p1  ORF type:complete len:127 (-),score=11.81 GHVU01223795.1:1022-1402(-)